MTYNSLISRLLATSYNSISLLGMMSRNDRRGYNNLYLKKAAFTLAEVLITLGVIGIVAAMTIPNLITKYQEKATITKLQQTYSILSQGFRRMIAENGTVDSWGNNATARKKFIYNIFPQYLQSTINCPSGSFATRCSGGVSSIYKRDNSWLSSFPPNHMYYNTHVLSNGVIVIVYMDGYCTQDSSIMQMLPRENLPPVHYGTHAYACGDIRVAVNVKKKVVSDKDIFMFKIVTDGIVPAGTSKESVWLETFAGSCLDKSTIYPGRCTAWVLENKNMDYLRCPEKLGWNKARSCAGK